MSIRELLSEGAKQLKKVNTERAFHEAKLLLAHILHSSYEEMIMKDELQVAPDEQDAFEALVKRRLKLEPMAYLLGQKEFYSLPFKVNKDVLIPRPETEELVEGVLKWIKDKKLKEANILDLGTGSGCIAISLAKHLDKNFKIVGLDQSENALEVAKENEKINLMSRIEWLKGDICSPIRFWNIIVSNPPYIPKKDFASLQVDVRDYEPKEALLGGEDGLDFYREIIKSWSPLISKAGLLALETSGEKQLNQVLKLIEKGKLWSSGPHAFKEF